MLSLLPRLAVVVPVYGNAQSLPELYDRIVQSAEKANVSLTLMFVNDRSPDDSQSVLERLAKRDPRVNVILLSRNHGSFVAIAAGLAHVAGHDAAVILSADLQDPPEIIPDMVREWKNGKKVVLCTRSRRDDPVVSRSFSKVFHWIFRRIALKEMPPGGFDFCLIDRQVIDIVLESSEKKTSLMGLILWTGFDRAILEYHRVPRKYGRSMWTFGRKLSYAFHSIAAFSSFPIKLSGMAGLFLTCFALIASFIVFGSAVFGSPGSGGASWLWITQLMTMGLLLLGFGVLGGYLWITLEQVRKRPLFIVDKRIGTVVSANEKGGVPFFDIQALTRPLEDKLINVAKSVLASPTIILGSHVTHFERTMASCLGVKHAIGVANGTDAITLALWGAGLSSGDKVAVPALTAPPTVVAVLRAGCVPVFVDVEADSLLISLSSLESSLNTGVKAVIPVHLYGNACQMLALRNLCDQRGVVVIEDCAQAMGSTFEGVPCGRFGAASAFSFYPTKNLGAYGDAGAVVTDDADIAEKIRRMRFYGQDENQLCTMQGINSRLDEMQAALLSVRLEAFDEHNAKRKQIADFYDAHLSGLDPVRRSPGAVPHLYVVRPESRDRFRGFLASMQIGTGVHYAQALTRHPYLAANSTGNACPVAEAEALRVVSLPCHPGMEKGDAARVVEACLLWLQNHER